jgi:hypothetical protein
MIPHNHPSLTPGHHPRTSMSVHSRSRSSLISDNGRWSSRFGYENAPPLPEFSRTGAPLRSEGCDMGYSLDGHMLKAPVVHRFMDPRSQRKRNKGNKPHASKSLPDLRHDLNHRASRRSIPKYCLTKPLPPLPSEVYNGGPISDLRPLHGGDFFVPPSIEKPVEVKRKISKVGTALHPAFAISFKSTGLSEKSFHYSCKALYSPLTPDHYFLSSTGRKFVSSQQPILP